MSITTCCKLCFKTIKIDDEDFAHVCTKCMNTVEPDEMMNEEFEGIFWDNHPSPYKEFKHDKTNTRQISKEKEKPKKEMPDY